MVGFGEDEAMGGSGREAPLAGIKVLEIGVAMAGPFCGMTLGDYGADVVKIERIGEGDESRSWLNDPFPGKFSSYFAAANRNKRSLAVDLNPGPGGPPQAPGRRGDSEEARGRR